MLCASSHPVGHFRENAALYRFARNVSIEVQLVALRGQVVGPSSTFVYGVWNVDRRIATFTNSIFDSPIRFFHNELPR